MLTHSCGLQWLPSAEFGCSCGCFTLLVRLDVAEPFYSWQLGTPPRGGEGSFFNCASVVLFCVAISLLVFGYWEEDCGFPLFGSWYDDAALVWSLL